VTMSMPTEDRYTATKTQLLASIAFCMGGRAAEDVVFQQFSTGASDDLSKATRIARDMICSYGMSEKIGPVSVEDGGAQPFLGRELGQHAKHSEQTAREIDQEVEHMLSECYRRAKGWVVERRELLDKVAEGLLERETLDDQELGILLQGGELPPLAPPVTRTATGAEIEKSEGKAGETPESDFGDKGIPEPEPMPG